MRIITTNNKGTFLQGIIIFILALILLISVGFTFLWIFLDGYERNTPQYYINRYIENFGKKSVKAIMIELGVDETPFFTADDYEVYLDNILGKNRTTLIAQLEKNVNDTTTIYRLSNEKGRGVKLLVTENPKEESEAYSVSAFDDELEFKEMTILSPEEIPIFANGIKVGEEFKLEDKKPVQSFDVAHDKGLVPKLSYYQIGGFLENPTITVEGDAKVEILDSGVMVTVMPSQQEQKAIETVVIDASKKYATFISNDTKFAEFSKYILKETDYYRSIAGFDPSWYIDHDNYAFKEMKVDKFVKYSPTAFSVEVAFDFYVVRYPNAERDGKKRKVIEKTYPTKYKISLIKRDNKYIIVNLEVI